MNIEITTDHIKQIFDLFKEYSYLAGSCEDESNENIIVHKCEELFKLDYNIIELDNLNGALSTRYPCRIFIPEYEKSHHSSCLNNLVNFSNIHIPTNSNQKSSSTTPQPSTTQQNVIYEDLYDATKIREIVSMAKYARCRQRFIVPVIMFRGKYICRSATISRIHETYGRKAVDYAFDYLSGSKNNQQPNVEEDARIVQNDDTDDRNDERNEGQSYESIGKSTIQSPFTYEEVIKSDIQLLNSLNVTTIIDLMVEQKKTKFFVTLSSSEKADPDNHYENFNVLSLPYPGCEFFNKFRGNNYMAKNLMFNWQQSFIDAKLTIPKNSIFSEMDINWLDYQNWDLILITQNYLKAMLKYLQDENNGLLVHCISGWDRTPLFISLIRISLWADGLIHQSLSAIQITYLTLAYDWYLFGHQLPDRLRHGEEILFFTFYFLKHITDDEFAVLEQLRKRTKTTSSSSSGGSTLNFKNDYFDDDSKDDLIVDDNSNNSNSNDSFVNLELGNLNETTTLNNITKSRSPNAKRNRTSPISVPGVCRQRNESSSSNGSWQVVNAVGSVDSVQTNMMCYVKSDQPENVSSNSNKPVTTSLRKQRLNQVRTIFIQSYSKFVGLQFQEGFSLLNTLYK